MYRSWWLLPYYGCPTSFLASFSPLTLFCTSLSHLHSRFECTVSKCGDPTFSIYEDLNALPLALPVTVALPSRDMVCGSKSWSRQVERTNFYVGDTVRPLQQRTSLIGRMAPIDVCHTCRKCMRSKIDVQQTLRMAESVWCTLRRGPQCLSRTYELDMSHQLAIDRVQVTYYIHMRTSTTQLSRL